MFYKRRALGYANANQVWARVTAFVFLFSRYINRYRYGLPYLSRYRNKAAELDLTAKLDINVKILSYEYI
jgi:hypothetical protein